MPPEIPGSDWRTFRELREIALERLCERALREAKTVAEDPSRSSRERFRDLFARIADYDERIARGFDDPKRSTMRIQLAHIRGLGLLEEAEWERFSEETRRSVDSLARSSEEPRGRARSGPS